MNCEMVKELSSQFLDNELPDEGSVDVLTHSANCKECRYFLRSMLQLRKEMLTLSVPSVSGDFDVHMMNPACLSVERTRTHRDWFTVRSARSVPRRMVDGAIVFILVLFIGVFFSSTVSSVESSSADDVGSSQYVR